MISILNHSGGQPGKYMTVEEHIVRSALGLSGNKVKYVDVHGLLPSTLKITDRLVWPIIADYTPFTAAKTLAASSSDSADTSKSIYIEYLDSNWEYQTATITTDAADGQVKETSAITDCLRVLSAEVRDATFAGNVYIFDNASAVTAGVPDTLTAIARYIPNGCGKDMSAFYTIPAGYTGLIGSVRGAIESTGAPPTDNEAANFCIRKALLSGATRLRYTSLAYLSASVTGSSIDDHCFDYGIALPEKTDFYINHVKSTADALQVSAAFSLVLIETAYLVQ